MELETALTSRDQINSELRKELDEATGKWGIRVGRVELKAIEPPGSIQDSMEKQMRADRDKRAAILSAEGSKQSAILTAEGERQAAVLKARGTPRRSCSGPRLTPRPRRRGPAGRPRRSARCSGPSTKATPTSGCWPTSTCRCCRRSPRATRTRSGSCRARSPRRWRESAVSSARPAPGSPSRPYRRAQCRLAQCRLAQCRLAQCRLAQCRPDPRRLAPGWPDPGRPVRCRRTGPERQGLGLSSTRPSVVTRVWKDGWRAVAGPCTTVPSAITKLEPCQGQATQAAPRSTTIRP